MTPRITDEQVAALSLGAGRAELLEEIMATPVLDQPTRTDRDRRRSPWVPAAAAAAVTLVVGGAAWLGSRPEPRAVETPVAGGPEAPGGTGYRAVLTEPGWRVADLYDPGDGLGGSIAYERGDLRLEVHWYPAASYSSYVEDRDTDLGRPDEVDLLGRPSKLWSYDDQDFEVMRPAEDDHFLAVRGTGLSRPDFLRLLGGLRAVDEAGFADALGDDAVTPANSDRVVAEILADVPLPEGFEEPRLESAYFSRYQAIAETTGPVACAWARHYDRGMASGDPRAVDEATDAMVGSRHWASLREIAAEGGWAEALWELADAMADGDSGLQERFCGGIDL